ncbi:MAG: hypothetical protein FJ319_00845 [SAR202 cluster bacterium]|nr:hypothetical protein [SAR202 cluster bacterium]
MTDRRLVTITVLLLLASVISCTPKADPFVVSDRRSMIEGTPTPRPTPAGIPVGSPTGPDTFSPYDTPARGTIRLAQWDDNALQIVNFVAGYLAVYGYIYSVEMVQVPSDQYPDALANGAVDAVMDFDRGRFSDWYASNVSAEKFVDLGSAFGAKENSRIVVSSLVAGQMKDACAVFSAMTPEPSAIERLASIVTGGRTGISVAVAGLIYFKENEASWTAWVQPEAATLVRQAIADGRNSLKRKCTRAGISANPCTD